MFNLENVSYKNILKVNKLEIPKNKTTCIVGESGSGKTTLLKLLNRMISPEGGRLTFKGTNLKDLNPIELRREVVMLPQTPIIYEGSIRDNLIKGIIFSERTLPSDKKLRSVMGFLNINKDINEDCSNLSGGEKQRIAIGRVILMEPEVFLLDEPSSALDESSETKVIEYIKTYCRDHEKTLIMVTHSKAVANTFADNVILIKNGRVVEEGEK